MYVPLNNGAYPLPIEDRLHYFAGQYVLFKVGDL